MAPRGILFDNDKVREAISTSMTWSEALRKLGITPQADNFRRIREAAERSQSSLKTQPVKEKRRPGKRVSAFASLSDDEFRRVLAEEKNLYNVSKRIGISASGKSYQYIVNEIVRRKLSIPFYVKDKFIEEAERVIQEKESVARLKSIDDVEDDEIFKGFEKTDNIKELSEFLGVRNTKESRDKIREVLSERDLFMYSYKPRNAANTRYSFNEVFTADSKVFCTPTLKRYVNIYGILDLNKCYECGLRDEWNGNPIVMHIEHIDGDRYNNSVDNLTMLCPNCHSQTDTYCRVKKAK